MKIYLAGGLRSGWRETVKMSANYPDVKYLDPNDHNLSIPSQYTNMDLHMIDNSDLVFGYLEGNNPGGYNTLFELGYAVGKGIPIIFISEKPDWDRYVGMVKQSSLFYTDIFEEGVMFLGKYLRIIR